MASIVISGTVTSGQSALDHGISDLMVLEQNGATTLYASSGQTGGLSAYGLGANGAANLLDFSLYNAAWADGALHSLSLIATSGATSIAVAGSGDDQLRLYDLQADGSIGAEGTMVGISSQAAQLLDVDQSAAATLFMADSANAGIRGYTIGETGNLTQSLSISDTSATYLSQVMALESTSFAGRDYVIAVSQDEKGVSVFRQDVGGLTNTGNAGVREGIGIMTPTDMEMVQIGGRSLILVASAPADGAGESGAITVMELAPDGSLVSTDHVIDTAATRFGDVQSLTVIEADGRIYVAAGGGDDGLTLFVLMPNGRLQFLAAVAEDARLENISATAAHFDGANLNFYTASETRAGITLITADASNHGVVVQGDHGGGTVNGTAGDDILIGGAQNDAISGGAGDDLIQDGLGHDTMTGGAGADIFILSADFTHDVITDFTAGIDRLDLSSWPMLYDPAALDYTATASGALLSWRGETLELVSANGQTLSFAQVQAAILQAPNRAPDFSNYGGNGGDQTLNGTAIDDAIAAGAGDDVVSGFSGNDYIDGGSGLDIIRGHAGNDTIFGGDDRDFILGDNNNDLLFGERGADVIRGGNGHDTLDGGEGNDRLFGAFGEDVLDGGTGNDLIRAGFNSDHLDGGAGDDVLFGGGGFDTLIGGEGNDTLQGDGNADFFVFHDDHGHDTILDFVATASAEKIDFTGHSGMNTIGEVLGRAVKQGGDVLIDTGADSSVLLVGVTLSDLGADDFLF